VAHIAIKSPLPGIGGLFEHRPETAKPLRELAQTLLRGPSTLSPAEREIIAAHVSALNDCRFCTMSHGAAASHLLGRAATLELGQGARMDDPSISAKLGSLLAIAGQVQQGGQRVTAAQIAEARKQGATDLEIHDAVLIAAAFCMFNRYVDGLATWSPEASEDYRPMGERLARQGYIPPGPGPSSSA
jgi:uncharacterized peroxidase-related enzyme